VPGILCSLSIPVTEGNSSVFKAHSSQRLQFDIHCCHRDQPLRRRRRRRRRPRRHRNRIVSRCCPDFQGRSIGDLASLRVSRWQPDLSRESYGLGIDSNVGCLDIASNHGNCELHDPLTTLMVISDPRSAPLTNAPWRAHLPFRF